MINFIRILTFIIALVITFFSIFHIDPDQEIKQAQKAFYSGDMDQTIRMARRSGSAFKENNKKVQALYLQAKAAMKMNWNKKAKVYLDQLLLIDEDNIMALFLRGKLENSSGNFKSAYNDFKKGFDLKANISKNTMAYYHSQFGLASLNLGDTDHAEKEAIKAISLNERLPEPHDLMSRVYEKKGNIKAALDECERAYQLSVQRDKLSFMTPEGRELSDRLVNLRAQNIRLK